MIPDVYTGILEQLSVKTEAGAVEWTASVNQQEFLVYFDKFTMSVRSGYDEDRAERFVQFTLKNANGKNIDSFAVSDVDPWFDRAENLHTAARRKANKVDEALKVISAELSSSRVVGRRIGLIDEDDEVPF